jgi:hypothetical protein
MRATLSIRNNPMPPEMADRLPGRMASVQKSGHLRLGTHSNAEEAMSKKTVIALPWGLAGNHLIPVDDLRQHKLTNCWCRPEYDDGLVIHNSLDQRELYETGDRQLS